MAAIGSVPSFPSQTIEAAGSSTSVEASQAQIKPSQVGPVEAIEKKIGECENQLATLYANARLSHAGNPPAPNSTQVQGSDLIVHKTRENIYMTVAYRPAPKARKVYCRLNSTDETDDLINKVDAYEALKAELRTARKLEKKRPGSPSLDANIPSKRPAGTQFSWETVFGITELLVRILDCLEPDKQREVRFVCKRWKNLNLGLEFMQRLRISTPDKLTQLVEVLGKGNHLHRVHALTLQGISFRTEHLALLEQFSSLKELNIRFGRLFTDDCALHISRCPNLETLNAYRCDFGNNFLAQLFPDGNDNLQVLDFSYCSRLTDECAPYVSRFPKLKRLILDSCTELTHNFLVQLFPNVNGKETQVPLEELNLRGQRLTNACAREVSRFPMIKHLHLSFCPQLTDNFMAQLFPELNGEGAKVHLESLFLDGCNGLTAACITSVRRFREIRNLGLRHCSWVDDNFLAQLLLDPNGEGGANIILERLHLSFCHGITDGSIPSLARCSGLKELSIEGSALTDAFATQLPPNLKKLSCLFSDAIVSTLTGRMEVEIPLSTFM